MRRPDGLVSILYRGSSFVSRRDLLGRVPFLGQDIRAILGRYKLPCSLLGHRGYSRRVGSHIGNEASLIEFLRYLHSLRQRESELLRRQSLKSRSVKRRRRLLHRLLFLHARDLGIRILERLGRLFRFLFVLEYP